MYIDTYIDMYRHILHAYTHIYIKRSDREKLIHIFILSKKFQNFP
jgi:hypothetical protein